MIINWGDAPFKAFITVTYPSGTCTVTGEGQSYTHSGGGSTTFTVRKKGTYTVKATATNASAAASAEITKSGQTKVVDLQYKLTINFNKTIISKHSEATNIRHVSAFLDTYTNLTAYKKLTFNVTNRVWSNVGSGYIRFGINPSSAAAPTKYTTANGTGATTVTLDISSVSGGYIGISCDAYSGGVTGLSQTGATVSTVIATS